MAAGGSLWSRIPAETRLDLIPIVSTGLLAKGGPLTAALIVWLARGERLDQNPHLRSVGDLAGIFLFVNFIVVFGFGYRTLKNAIAKDVDVSLDVKVIGLGAAFVTVLELYSFALQSARPELLAYCLLVLFYVFFAPFFLVRRLTPEPDQPTAGSETARQSLAAMELVVCALLACGAAVIACSIYFSLLNDGVPIGHPRSSFVRDVLEVKGRAEFWGFSPGILGIGWLPALLATSASAGAAGDGARYGLDGRSTVILLAGTLLINAVVAMALIDSGNFIPADAPQPLWVSLTIKVGLATLLTGAFLLAFFAMCALRRMSRSAGAAELLSIIVFAIAGAAAGFAVILIRRWVGACSPVELHLLWMHAGGFVLAYAAGGLAGWMLKRRRWLTSVVPNPVCSRAGALPGIP